MTQITALIVDDEPLARDKIRTHLRSHPEIAIIGECGDGPSAVRAVHSLKPNLLFLDVQMPGSDGFTVLESIDVNPMPAIVFVTAFDKYAVRAFEVHALDYLLKPFDRQRFDEALSRVVRQINQQNTSQNRLLDLMEELKSGGTSADRYAQRLVVRTHGRIIFLGTDEIDWIESAANYVRLHVGKESHLMRETMAGIESRLDPKDFVRIHRSYIARIDRIREMEHWSHGEYVLILKDGTQLTSSRGYRDQVGALLGRNRNDRSQ
ncbi:MAG: LytTR family DNA-binding domain-containing protein [bacterium]|nr:LytTR family DNA-binding domain-containing protein [bacterium]